MRELISLRAFGLSELDAVRYYVALKMAEHGLLTAPNMAVGEPFNVGLTAATLTAAAAPGSLPGLPSADGGMPGVPGVPGVPGIAGVPGVSGGHGHAPAASP